MTTLSAAPQKRATLQQQRAKHAWETVRTVSDAGWADFEGHTKRLGPRIVTAGLGPALAFAAARDGKPLVDKLSDWVLHKGVTPKRVADLQQSIRDGSSEQLRQWTAEALEWIVWVKRFCAADQRSQETDQTGGGRP
jgi:CRISPR/Cas system CMR-associated protein Cmr5 small subunit